MTIGPGSHSPVGASSIKRVLMCPASVDLSRGIKDPESEHAALGTAVHAVIELSFKTQTDAWEHIGKVVIDGEVFTARETDGHPITPDMAVAAQVMLDAVRSAHPERNQGNFWVERRFHCPSIHPLFYGTSDAVHWDEDEATLHVWDYKNGAGVVVEVEHNQQGMYYACGALEDLALWDTCECVAIHIVQPNGFHMDGPVREWRTTPDELAEWLEDVLIVGINSATQPGPKNTASGEHCRFCPARTHACPQLMSDMDELEALMQTIANTPAEELTNAQIERLMSLVEKAKIVGKAAEQTAFHRINAGQRIPGYKLAKARAFRTWKDGAEDQAKAEFGPHAVDVPAVKSPAQIDKLPGGKAFTSRWAFSPDTGLTLVKESDARPEVSTDTKALFTPVKKPFLQLVGPVTPLIPEPEGGGRRKKPVTV